MPAVIPEVHCFDLSDESADAGSFEPTVVLAGSGSKAPVGIGGSNVYSFPVPPAALMRDVLQPLVSSDVVVIFDAASIRFLQATCGHLEFIAAAEKDNTRAGASTATHGHIIIRKKLFAALLPTVLREGATIRIYGHPTGADIVAGWRMTKVASPGCFEDVLAELSDPSGDATDVGGATTGHMFCWGTSSRVASLILHTDDSIIDQVSVYIVAASFTNRQISIVNEKINIGPLRGSALRAVCDKILGMCTQLEIAELYLPLYADGGIVADVCSHLVNAITHSSDPPALGSWRGAAGVRQLHLVPPPSHTSYPPVPAPVPAASKVPSKTDASLTPHAFVSMLQQQPTLAEAFQLLSAVRCCSYGPFIDWVRAGESLGALSRDLILDRLWTISEHPATLAMQIDSQALASLNILSRTTKLHDRHPSTLYGFMNQCQTAMGSRLLRSLLTSPSLSVHEIEHRHGIVGRLMGNSDRRQSVRAKLHDCVDLASLAARFADTVHVTTPPSSSADSSTKPMKSQRGVGVSLQQCVAAYRSILVAQTICGALLPSSSASHSRSSMAKAAAVKGAEEAVEGLVASLQATVTELEAYCELMETCVNLTSVSRWGMYHVSPSLHPELERLHGLLDTCTQTLKETCASSIAKMSDAAKKNYVRVDWNHKVFGTHLRVPNKSMPHFRATFMGDGGGSGKKRARPAVDVIELGLRTDGLHVTTAGIAQASKGHQAAMSAYHDAQASIEHEVIATACTHWKSVSKLAETLALLDVLCSFAHVAANEMVPWVRPTMLIDGTDDVVQFEQLRHPLVEAALSNGKESSAYVPNDVCFRRGEASAGPHVVLITGPNMGGKTTYMKSIAVAIILAQIGSFVPAKTATVGLVDSMFAKFSAKEDLLAGTSSFTAEMHDIASILQRVGPRSFTILDEIAQGTSTNDGTALASGIVNHLMAPGTGCTVIATHFHELTDMARSPPTSTAGGPPLCPLNPPAGRAVSVHLDARLEHGRDGSDEQLRFSYSVELGASTRSMGLDVALAMGIPSSIVRAARARLIHDTTGPSSTPETDGTIVTTQPDD